MRKNMSKTNPITEEVKKTAEENGCKVENVAEGTMDKERIDTIDRVTKLGASLIIQALVGEGIALTDEQKEKIEHAYQASFAITALLLK